MECDETAEVTLDPLQHKYDAGTVEQPYPCEDGVKTYVCTQPGCTDEIAGHSYKDVVQASTGHLYTITGKKATCTEPAKVGQFCQYCGEAKDGKIEDAPGSQRLGHDYETVLEDGTVGIKKDSNG